MSIWLFLIKEFYSPLFTRENKEWHWFHLLKSSGPLQYPWAQIEFNEETSETWWWLMWLLAFIRSKDLSENLSICSCRSLICTEYCGHMKVGDSGRGAWTAVLDQNFSVESLLAIWTGEFFTISKYFMSCWPKVNNSSQSFWVY